MVSFSKEYVRRVFLRDRLILYPLCGAVVVHILMWGLLLWRGLPLRTQTLVPLHYTIYFGIDLVGPWYGIFTGAVLGLIVLVVNIIMIFTIYERYRLFAYFFAIGTTLLELMLLVGSIFTILLNI